MSLASIATLLPFTSNAIGSINFGFPTDEIARNLSDVYCHIKCIGIVHRTRHGSVYPYRYHDI